MIDDVINKINKSTTIANTPKLTASAYFKIFLGVFATLWTFIEPLGLFGVFGEKTNNIGIIGYLVLLSVGSRSNGSNGSNGIGPR